VLRDPGGLCGDCSPPAGGSVVLIAAPGGRAGRAADAPPRTVLGAWPAAAWAAAVRAANAAASAAAAGSGGRAAAADWPAGPWVGESGPVVAELAVRVEAGGPCWGEAECWVVLYTLGPPGGGGGGAETGKHASVVRIAGWAAG
jgi:hypothetical protein